MAIGSILRRPAVLLALALCSVGGVVTLLGRLATGPRVEEKRVALAQEAGANSFPAWAPNGKLLAYSARGSQEDDVFHIFVRPVPGGPARQLTSGDASDTSPAWSPDGASIAFSRSDGEHVEYLLVPSAGGPEQKVAEFPIPSDGALEFSESWTHDGKSLIVVEPGERPALALVSIDGGTPRRITNPAEGTEGDITPATSPDGRTLAFVRSTGSDGSDVYLSDLNGGALRRLTFDNRGIRGLAWTPDGRDIVYASDRFAGWRIWRVPAYGGSPRDIPMAGRSAQYPALSPAGGRLAYVDSPSAAAVWRATIEPDGTIANAAPLLRSLGREFSAVYSPDGHTIADISDQTGADEIWLSDADGGHRRKLTSFQGPQVRHIRWSPDGHLLLFDMRSAGPEIYTLSLSPAAKPRMVAQGINGTWSHDGRHVYFWASGRLWRAAADGGSPETLVGSFGPPSESAESADGQYVYYPAHRGTIWRVPAAGGEGQEAIVPEHNLLWNASLETTPKGLYYLEYDRPTRTCDMAYYDFAAKRTTRQLRLKKIDMREPSFSISPDGKYIIYPRVDQSQTNLMALENFR